MSIRFKKKANTIKVDIRDFKQFEKKLQKMQDLTIDLFIKESATALAGEFLGNVKRRTPVGQYGKKVEFTTRDGEHVSFKSAKQPTVGGTLRNGWQMSEVKETGKGYEVEIFNNVPYAPFVENGHVIRNKKGGEAKGWVEGRFMLRNTEIEMVFITPQILEKKMERFLRKMLNGK